MIEEVLDPKSFIPFHCTVGDKSSPVALVGEAHGAHEAMFRAPFCWAAGMELARMAGEAQLAPPWHESRGEALETKLIRHWERSNMFLTNVFADHPTNNNLDLWCTGKAELPPGYTAHYLKPGKYFKTQYLPHVDRLHMELKEVRPNLIIALGAVACWAILGKSNISDIRGTVTWSKSLDCKVLPTFHPSAVLHNWSLRTIVVADLIKARNEIQFPEIRLPKRQITVSPTLEDIREWANRPAERYAVDIETDSGFISMIGFARARNDAIVIPFIWDGKNYWNTLEDEQRAWKLVRELLYRPVPKIFQNGLYDLSYLIKMGLKPVMCLEDTMLLHHSLHPEMRKSLGFMGSIYTREAAWKVLRKRKKDDMNKREE